MTPMDNTKLRPELYKLLHKYITGKQWYDGEVDQTLEAIEALFAAHTKEVLDTLLEQKQSFWNSTKATSIECVPTEVIEKFKKELDK